MARLRLLNVYAVTIAAASCVIYGYPGYGLLVWFCGLTLSGVSPQLGLTFNKFQSFVEALAEKVHNLQADTLTVFLTTNANTPVATNTQLSNITQISYTNLSARVLTVSSSAQTSGTYKLVIADLVLTASGAVATFQQIGIYNDTASNDELICWFDYGSSVTLGVSGETLTLDFDGTNGLLTIGP